MYDVVRKGRSVKAARQGQAFEKMLALVCHICYNIKGLNTKP